ncbi:unnamed protein product [Paramecium sonneborni]|uniref:WD40-repeat-containing domain n=1 Tax=Paramecium sonneborni TaxID=65129 RepID=A0A8S1P4D2_9CILI|nr:unnamed protein product [Paramecium sonneborni]
MFEPKVIEKELKCSNQNHKEAVEMVIWDPQLKKEQRLICKICQQEQSGAKILMPLKEAFERTLEKQKKMMEKISPAIQENEKYLKTLESEINKLKDKAFQALDGIIKNTKSWLEQLHKVGQSTASFSFLEELDKMIIQNEHYASEEQVQIMENIHNINNAFFQKIDAQLNNFFLFQEYQDCQNSLINVIQMNLSDFTQSKIKVAQENSGDNAHSKQKAFCKQHKKEIIFVNLAQNISKDLRSACSKCNRRDGEFFEEFIEKWKEFEQKQKDSLQKSQDNLSRTVEDKQELLNKIRFDIVSQFSKVINQLRNVMLKGLKEQFKTVNNLTMIFNEGQINEMAEKLSKQEQLKSNDLQLEITGCMQNLISEISNSFGQFSSQKDLQLKKVLKKTIEDEALSIGMAFNQDGSQFISSSNSNLILWNLNQNEITKVATLKGHNDYINCVVFNKSSNGIISGCEDSSIRLWKSQNKNEWESVEAEKKHYQRISCLVLNSKEDQLFSGSGDSKICVWNIDFQKKQINLKQILQNHNQDVFSLSLNEENTFLVSCSFDQKIVVWEIQNNEWKFKQLIDNEVKDFGYRLSFLNENMFIWITANEGQGQICVFKLENQKFEEQKDKKLQLAHSTNTMDCMYFPIVYNKNKNVAYVKHKKHLYIIKLGTGSSNWTTNEIELDDAQHLFGAISPDGQTLVTYNLDEQKLQFYGFQFQ